jgi:AAA domain
MEIPLNEVERVEMIPVEISFIRRYAAMHGKVKTRKQLLTLLSSLQKAMLEKRIRKSSPYAAEIMQVQAQLSSAVNCMGEAAEISIAAASLERYRAISSSKRISDSVALLKRYLLLHGRAGVQERAEKLAAAIKRAVKQQKVTKEDPYARQLDAAYQSLTKYLERQSEVPDIASGELNGILGLVGKKAGSRKAAAVKGETLASRELLRMEFETIGLRGRFRELIGDPSVGFTAMVFGKPKSGKSTLMLRFAHHLAVHHGKVLYCAIEEGYGYTLKEKIERLGAAHERLVISDRLPKQLGGYDFVFIDSVSKAGMELEDLVKLKRRYAKTSFVFVFHSTKDGRFRGGNEMAHEVDVIVEVESGVARASGRFLAGGEMRV